MIQVVDERFVSELDAPHVCDGDLLEHIERRRAEIALDDAGIIESFERSASDLSRTVFGRLTSTLPADQHRVLEPIGVLISQCFRSERSEFNFPSLAEALEERGSPAARDHAKRIAARCVGLALS